MAYKMYAAFIASLSIALTFASNETFGASGTVNGGTSASTHSTFHPSGARPLPHHIGRHTGALWPAAGGLFSGPANGEPEVDVTEPMSGDVHYTCTYDIPWDWVHRCPSFVSPSERVVTPHEPGCPAQTVTIPMGDGKEKTVTIVRC